MKKAGFGFRVLCFGLVGLTALSASAGTTLVGELKGELKVNNLGAANYTIPLSVSPGTAGMEPKLAISYSSRIGNGPLGVGFSLSGLSTISRVSASPDQDGFYDPVDFDDYDRFVLNGQRLDIVGFTGSSTTDTQYYGKAESEYRTEIDSFSRVIAKGQAGNGPAWFKVWAKDGLIYEYGNTVDYPSSYSAFKPGTYPEAMSWQVNKISDTVGNYMTFTYTDPAVTGRPLISRIDYTGNVGAGLDTYNSVEFVYEDGDRPDTLYRSFREVQMNETKRLKTIIMKHDDAHVHEYRLVYTTNEEGESLLESIQQFFGPEPDADHLPKTEFSYSGTTAISQDFDLPADLTSVQSMSVYTGYPVLTGNFNGDGKTDVLFVGPNTANHWVGLSNANGTFDIMQNAVANFLDIPQYSKDYQMLQTGDFNADGLTDICQVRDSSTHRWVAICNGDGTFTVTVGDPELPVNFGMEDTVFVMDVDADGRDDIFGLESTGSGARWIAHSNVNGSFTVSSGNDVSSLLPYDESNDAVLTGDFDGNGFPDIMGLGPNAGHNWVGLSNGDGTFTKTEISGFTSLYNPDKRVGTGDFNGDGLTDFYQIQSDPGYHTIALSNGDGTFDFSKSSDLQVDGYYENQVIQTGDFNGDGLTDICRLFSGETSWIALCDGDGTFTVTDGANFLPSASAPISNTAGGTRTIMRDFNGDGKTDILGFTQSYACWLALSDGDGSFTFSNNPDVFGNVVFNATHDALQVGDFNGDGMPDVLRLGLSSSGNWIGLNNHEQSLLEQVVQKIPNATDAWPTIQIDYLPASDETVYVKGSGAQYPIRDIVPGLHVVSTVAKTSNSDLPENTQFYYTDYTYRSAREHMEGRGFLGFKQFESYDRQTQLAYVKTLSHEYPFTGETLSSETFYIPDPNADPIVMEPIKRIDNSWLYDEVSGGTIFAYTSKSVETKWELGQPATPISVVTAWNWYDGQNKSTLPPSTQPTTLNGLITHGNVVKTLMDYDGTADAAGLTVATVNTYDDWVDPWHWLLGRLDTVSVTHDAPGQDPVIRTSSFDYDATTGLLAVETIEPGDAEFELRTDYYRDAFGNVERKQLSGAGIATHDAQNVDYDPKGRVVVASRNALGHETTFDYTDPDPIYQALAKPKSSTDPNQLTTTWNYDDLGRKIYERRPDGTETTGIYSWDIGIPHAFRKLETRTDGQAPVTIWFDKLGREIRSETLREYTYPGTALPARRASYKDTAYNDIGLITSISRPYSGATTVDIGGGSWDEWEPAEMPVYTTMEYDALKRAQYITAPDGTVTETVYDGLTTRTIVDSDYRTTGSPAAKNQVTTTVKNTKGEVLSVTDADNKTVTYTYDPVGNLITTQDPDGNLIEMRYDIRGNKIWQDDPDMGEWSYAYNTLDQLVSQTDAKGNVIEFEYDPLGRPETRVNKAMMSSGLKLEGTAQWYYDGTGDGAKLGTLRREEYRDGTGAFINRKTYAYDAYSRPMIELRNYDSKWFYTTLEYDQYSRIKTIGRFWRPVGLEGPASQLDSTWHSFTTSNTYDQNGLMTKVLDDSNHVWWQCNTEDYNAAGQLERFEYGNDLVTTRDYDPFTGWIEGMQIKDSGLQTLSGYGYAYDRIGNLTQRSQTRYSPMETTLTEDCTYDNLNRLKTSTVAGQTPITAHYNAIGNIQTRSDVVGTHSTYEYLSGKPHAVTAAGDCTYMYDANGNVVRRDRNGSYEFSANWNSFNKPVSLFSGLEGSEFEYDVNGQRTKQLVFEDDGAGGIRVRKKIYVADSFEIEEVLSNPTETDRSQWVWTPVHSRIYVDSPAGRIGIYQEHASSDGSGPVTRSYLHHDHIGSVVAVSDDAATPGIIYYSFDAWGNRRDAYDWSPIAQSEIGNHQSAMTDRGYTGHEQLDHLQLVHMNGRIYDPVIGRMITPDPTIPAPHNLQAFNRYSYVYNNPLSFIDPGGHTPEQVAAASSGVTAEALNAANVVMAENTSAEAAGNSGLANFDGLASTSGGGGGGDDSLQPIKDEYGNITGWSSGSKEEGDYQEFGLDEFSESDLASMEENWEDTQKEDAKDAEHEVFGEGDVNVIEDMASEFKDSLSKLNNKVNAKSTNGSKTEAAKNAQGYNTPDEAAKAALDSCNQTSIDKNKEYSGYIYKKDGKYYYTTAKPGKMMTADLADSNKDLPDGVEIVGDYHTHGNYKKYHPLPNVDLLLPTNDPREDVTSADSFSQDDFDNAYGSAEGRSEYHIYLGTPGNGYQAYDVLSPAGTSVYYIKEP